MQYVETNGARIPKIGFGTFELDNDTAERRVADALEAGYRHIDTAQMYRNEAAVGRGIAGSGVDRDEIFVTTKVWPDRFRDGDLQQSVRESLDRLGLARVDLLLLHWPNHEVALAETIGALNDVAEQGLTRHIGVSNFNVALLDEAVSLSRRPLITNQVEYHPYLSQQPVLEALGRHGMALTAYCPLGKGRAIGDATIRRIADAHGKDPAQIVLRWHYQQPNVIAIPRSSKSERVHSNLEILDFELSNEEMGAIHGLAREDGRIISPAGLAPAWDNAG